MNFGLDDYRDGLRRHQYLPPFQRCRYLQISKSKYRALEQRHRNKGNDLRRAFAGVRQRVSTDYYRNVHSVQHRTMGYSRLAFPAYGFILPEVIADDWLAIVDWHGFQRDHVLHQPLTAYVVNKMLTGDGQPGSAFRVNGIPLLDQCVRFVQNDSKTDYLRQYLRAIGVGDGDVWSPQNPNSRHVTTRLWHRLFARVAYLAATFHDIGYPWQYLTRLGSNLDHAGHRAIPDGSRAKDVLESHGARLLFYPVNGYRPADPATPATWHDDLLSLTEEALTRTHGLPGALGFLYLNDVVRRYPREASHPINAFAVEWASMAILMHDMVKLYWGSPEMRSPRNHHMRLSFDRDPLSSLLALADVIEDFGRPISRFMPNKSCVCLEYRYACNAASVDVDASGDMSITYWFPDNAALAMRRKWLLKDQHDYFHKRYGFLDLTALGIRKVVMNARVGRP
jgi:hypothetical protein